MAHGVAEIVEFPTRRLERMPSTVKAISLALLLVGVVAFVGALATDAERAWRAYLFNWLFWTSIAQGAVLLAAVVTIVRGAWARSVRRIALSFVAFLPLSFLLMIPLFFVGGRIFPWVGEDLHGKEVWLNMPFLATRNIIGVGALFLLSLIFAYWMLRPDAGRLLDDVPARLRGLYERLAGRWRGAAAEDERAAHKLGRLGPPLAIVYALVFTLVSFDFSMSLDPEWWSMLYGGYFFMGAFYGGVAATALAVVWYRGRLGLQREIGPSVLHDLGKLTFALAIFWTYLFWSQFIVIWYGLLPHEQSFVVYRFEAPFTWAALSVFALLFVIPFAGLLGVKPKKNPFTLGLFSSLILVGLWLERYLLNYPSYYHGGVDAPFGWQEIGIGLAFGGLFLSAIVFFATRFPVLQLWEPLSEAQILGTTTGAPGEAATRE